LPIFITLKDFADQENHKLMAFMAHEFKLCGVPDAQGFIKQLLTAGKCRLLLDGLDEVPEQHLKKTIQAVEHFTDCTPTTNT
jgi:predicted NACHT family NTPase